MPQNENVGETPSRCLSTLDDYTRHRTDHPLLFQQEPALPSNFILFVLLFCYFRLITSMPWKSLAHRPNALHQSHA